MKTAMCHYSLRRRWAAEKWDLKRLVQEVRQLGVDGVDFHIRLLGKLEGAAAGIKSALAGSGLAISGLSMGNDFNLEKADDLAAQVREVKDWLAVAADVRAPVCRVFGGALAFEKRGDPAAKAAAMKRIIDALGQVVQEAGRLGLVLGLENHGGLPCSGEEQVEAIRKVNSPVLKATIDVGNYMECGQEAHVGTAVAAPYAAYVHFKDFRKIADPSSPRGFKLQHCGLGEGDVDHRACLAAMRKAGYDGFIALEYESPEDEMTGVPRSVAYLKKVIAEAR